MARRRPGREAPHDTNADRGPDADPESVARTILLTKLTTSAKSRHQLADALAARNVPDDVATRVLDRFAQVGLIDDKAFAESWVRSRQASRGLSRRALSHELKAMGVEDEIVRETVAGIDHESEAAAARRLVERKLGSVRSLDEPARIRRLVGMLARKGYPADLSFVVVRAVLDGDSSRT